ncbi:MAG: BACON domain-containing protein, partial [Candidatus Aminicenantes bacterium]
YQFKGNNRETAAKQFFDAVKDKARQSITTVFTPKEVENFTGQYNHTTGSIDLTWSPKIWPDLNHHWNHWGDFKEFVIYRGYTGDFQSNSSSEIARVTAYSYKDTGFQNADTVYYKIAAVNMNAKRGNRVTIGVNTSHAGTPELEISRTRLNFGACTCGAVTPLQVFLINNTGAGVMTWSVSDNANWLNCTPVSGINSGKVEVTVDASDKSAGTYNGTITVSSPGAANSPQTIDVTLKVYSAGTDAGPIGTFETPVNNSTVQSSIPVTGWVVDDIAVESVKIYRIEGSQLKLIGDAVLVEGARPDIEIAYPGYPNNYKAGWGYMMLTNFLPNQGNGSFTFYAIARDVTGHQVTLGTKTITCDNANAVKPFGAIDTPTQGGEASGSQFINWGWALTPQPHAIPTDGSTIKVYIDGVYIGHPVYNLYRQDIAALFPGYANSNGAAGYFFLDTTAYSNGVHTIAWSVRDNAGNVDGIGSRYFTIQNTGSIASSLKRGQRGLPPC